MQAILRSPPILRGSLSPPGDKSISHRAAILNSIAQGDAVVENMQHGADVLATFRCLQWLGVRYQWLHERTVRISGVGRDGLQEPTTILECRNSGTTIRLLTGLLAPQPFFSVLNGDASLRSRPMDRIVQPLTAMGADIRGRRGGARAPLAINGHPLTGISYRLPQASAQVKSALALAALYAKGDTFLEEPAPSRDHTERMLQSMGAQVQYGDRSITLHPLGSELQPLSFRVPGDISAAACWLVAAAVHPQAELQLEGVGVNPTRTGVITALRLMGADIALENERLQGPEPVADIIVRSSHLHGTVIEGDLVPQAIDELPLIALAACFAQGETVIRDAAELRVKESDRIRNTVSELRRLGADIEELADGMHIRGLGRLHGANVSSHSDHRLAMLLAVAGLIAQGETIIRNPQAVAISYSCFWGDLKHLAREALISSPE